MGGTKTIPLCAKCHGEVHDKKIVSSSALVKAGIAKSKAAGNKFGSARPGHWDGREHLRLAGLEKGRAKALVMRQEYKRAAYVDVVADIERWRSEGKTLRQIAALLNEAGHRTRRGKRWGSMQVHRVLEMELKRALDVLEAKREDHKVIVLEVKGRIPRKWRSKMVYDQFAAVLVFQTGWSARNFIFGGVCG